MTINEAIKANIARVRLPIWNATAYLKIHLVKGGLGPWVELWDRPIQEIIPAPTPQTLPAWDLGEESRWEESTGERDSEDKD